MRYFNLCIAFILYLEAIPIQATPYSDADITVSLDGTSLEAAAFGAPLHNVLVRQSGDNGNSCEQRCRKRCKGKKIKDPSNCRRCIPCPPGTKPDPVFVTCVKDESDEDSDNTRKGCPENQVLDPKEGPQKPDAEAKDLKCAIDDEKDCKPPKLPETRPNGKENDTSFKPKCLDVDESDKTKCDEKQQYEEVTVGPDGKAKKTCKPTRQYENKKKNRWQKMKDKFKKRWEDEKEERAKKNEERKARKGKIEEGHKKKEKEQYDRKKKKIKLYRCGMATAMEVGQEIAGLVKKRDLAVREKRNSEIESYMDMIACYFDADFVQSDDFLEFWPSDINVDDIGPEIDEKAYMESFLERMAHVDLEFWNTHDFCKRDGNWSLEARCTRKKRQEMMAKDDEYKRERERLSRLLKREIFQSAVERRDEQLNPEDFCDMSTMDKREARGVEVVQKRNILFFVEIAATAARMAGSLLARAIPNLSSFSPRLANILRQSPKNLFKLAPKGEIRRAGSKDAMKQAFGKLSKQDAFKKCVKDGKP